MYLLLLMSIFNVVDLCSDKCKRGFYRKQCKLSEYIKILKS